MDSVDEVLHALGPTAPPSERLAAICEIYEEATGRQLSDPLTTPESEELATWLTRRLVDGDLTLMMKPPTLRSMLHPRASDKANSITQLPCLSCSTAEPFGQRIDFTVRVRPFSMQSDPSIGGQLKARIQADLQTRSVTTPRWAGAICLRIMTLYGSRDRDKDVDNSVKGLVDAMQDAVYVNDSQVQHLSSHKLRHEGVDRFYRITASQVHPSAADVVRLNTAIRWSGPELTV